MKIAKFASSATILGFLTLAAGASASDTVYHGTLCNVQPLDVSKIEYNGAWGTQNNAASTANIYCGAATEILATINTVELEVYDRNAATNFSCTLTLNDIFGSAIFTQTKGTTGSSASAKLISYSPGVGTHTLNVGCSVPAISAGSLSHFTTYRVITP
jgi:hypothetical protein